MRRLFNNITQLIAGALASITGSRGLHGKPINITNGLDLSDAYAKTATIDGGNIFIRQSCRTTNQRKRRKLFRAQLANGSV
jgi:hypothetical protein